MLRMPARIAQEPPSVAFAVFRYTGGAGALSRQSRMSLGERPPERGSRAQRQRMEGGKTSCAQCLLDNMF